MTITEALAAADGTNVQVSGTVCAINTAWSDQYNNICVTLTDESGDELYIYRLATNVALGDIITVKGAMGTYNGRQIAAGATATIDGHDNSYDYVEMTIAEALAAADNTNVIVTGTVDEIATAYSEQYGNISVYIADDSGNRLYLYRLTGNVTVGQTIKVKGAMATYSGNRQVVGGTFELVEDVEPTPTTYTLILRGGSPLTGITTETLEYAEGASLELPTPTAEGKVFAGWIDLEGNAAPATMPAETLTLFESWTVTPYTLTIKQDGAEDKVFTFGIEYSSDIEISVTDLAYVLEDNLPAGYKYVEKIPSTFVLEDYTFTAANVMLDAGNGNRAEMTKSDVNVTDLGFAEGTTVYTLANNGDQWANSWDLRALIQAPTTQSYITIEFVSLTDVPVDSLFFVWGSAADGTPGLGYLPNDSTLGVIALNGVQVADTLKANVHYTMYLICENKDEVQIGVVTANTTIYFANISYGNGEISVLPLLKSSSDRAISLDVYSGDVTALGFTKDSTVQYKETNDLVEGSLWWHTSDKDFVGSAPNLHRQQHNPVIYANANYEAVTIQFALSEAIASGSVFQVWAYGDESGSISLGNGGLKVGDAWAETGFARAIFNLDGTIPTSLEANTVYVLKLRMEGAYRYNVANIAESGMTTYYAANSIAYERNVVPHIFTQDKKAGLPVYSGDVTALGFAEGTDVLQLTTTGATWNDAAFFSDNSATTCLTVNFSFATVPASGSQMRIYAWYEGKDGWIATIADCASSESMVTLAGGAIEVLNADGTPVTAWEANTVYTLKIYHGGAKNVAICMDNTTISSGSVIYFDNAVVRNNDEYVAPHVHNYVGVETTPATLNSIGTMTYTCDGCGDSYTEDIPMLEGAVANVNGYKYATFAEALEAAKDGDTLTLMANLTASDIILLDKAISLDGANYTLTSTAARAINVDCTGSVSITNLTIIADKGCERGVNIINNASNVGLENVAISFIAEQGPLYGVHIAYSANGATLKVENSNISAWGAVAVYGNEHTVTIENSTLVGTNVYSTTSNSFMTIALGGENIDVTVNGGVIKAVAEGTEYQWIVGSIDGATSHSNVSINAELVLEGENTLYNALSDLDNNTVNFPVAYATALKAEGFCVTVGEAYATVSSHSYEAVVTEPTCTEDGYTTYTCECGYSYTEAGDPATDHSFSEGTCGVCGAEDPNYYFPVSITEALAAADGKKVQVSGTVCTINTAWSDSYGNISVTIADADGNELYIYRLKTNVALGDIITVKGAMATYNEARQIAAGATATIDDHDNSYDYDEMTIAEAIASADNTNVIVTGTVVKIGTAYSSSYNNISVYIADEEGTQLYLYRLTGNVTVGQIIKVKGAMATYSGNRQLTGGTFEAVGTHTCSNWTAATCTTLELCVVCGTEKDGSTLLDHSFVDGICSVCGAVEGVSYSTETFAIAASAGTLASDSLSISWSSDNFNFVGEKASSSTAIRTSDTDHFRVYANSNFSITGKAGEQITKVVITCTSSSYATACAGSLTTTGVTAVADGKTVTLTVDSGSVASIAFTATEQFRVSNFEITYTK